MDKDYNEKLSTYMGNTSQELHDKVRVEWEKSEEGKKARRESERKRREYENMTIEERMRKTFQGW